MCTFFEGSCFTSSDMLHKPQRSSFVGHRSNSLQWPEPLLVISACYDNVITLR